MVTLLLAALSNCIVMGLDAWPAVRVCDGVVMTIGAPMYTFCEPDVLRLLELAKIVDAKLCDWLSSYLKLAELEPAAMVMLGVDSSLPAVSRNLPVLEELLRLMVMLLAALMALPLPSCSWIVM